MRVLLLLLACHAAPPAAPPSAAKLEPGADLDGPPPAPRRGVARRATSAPPSDLGRDRPAVKLNVPEPPAGGAASFDVPGAERAWVAHLPGSRQLPAVAFGGGKVFVSGGFEGYELYALDAEDGHIVWASLQLEDNGPTAPTYDGEDHLIFNTESCTLFCLDARTGKKLWHKWLGDPTLAQPAVAGGLIFASHPSPEGPAFSAYKVQNGDEVWTRVVGGELLAAPVLDGDSVYVATIEGRLFRFQQKSGAKIWSQRIGAATAPFIANGEVYVTRAAHGQETQLVLSAETGKILRTHASVKTLGDVPANLDDWKRVWAFEGSRPVVSGGVRYVAMGGVLEASDPMTGEKLWQRQYQPGSRTLGSVALAGAALVVSTRKGDLFGVDIDTGYTLWAYQLGHNVSAEPIVARGWVYTATRDGRVVALKVADATLDGWHMFGGNPKHNGPML